MHLVIPQLRFATARLATGVEVHYAEQGDPSLRSGDGEALVFLHGWPDSWFSFSRLLPLLPARYHAYAFSQRGFGDSERPAGGYAIDDYAADVAAFLDAVGVERATIIGSSSGGVIARWVAETRPERVSRLVQIGSFLRHVNEATLAFQEAVRTLADPVPPDFAREFQAGTAHLPLPTPFLERAVAESLKLPARVWQAVLDGFMAADDVDRLGRIAAPTLLLWGERDALIPREDQEQLAATIPGARLIVYPETGHALHWERPERVVADLDAFLREA